MEADMPPTTDDLRVMALPLPDDELADRLIASPITELPESWASLPEVWLMLASAHRMRRRAAAVQRWAGVVARAIAPSTGPELTRVGPVLLVSTSIQTQRVLGPIRDELVSRFGPARQVRLPSLGPRGLSRAAGTTRDLLREYGEWFRAASLPAPPELGPALLKVEALRLRSRADHLRSLGITSVAVASQHNGATRAVLATTLTPDSGLVSSYLPHAPLVPLAYYEDLPVHRALLRGEAESHHYAQLGADPDRLTIVGDPSRPDPRPALPESDELVFAPSPHPEPVLRADIALLAAMDRPWRVSLHPRMDAQRFAELVPPSWRVVQTDSTALHLQAEGARAVVQHGSGVGLDALALGIDVIDLRAEGAAAVYPYLRAPQVQTAHDASSLHAALAALPQRANGSAGRITYAATWSAAGGAEAAARAADELVGAQPIGEEPLLDRWGRRSHPERGEAAPA
jgi:hypothetical protein